MSKSNVKMLRQNILFGVIMCQLVVGEVDSSSEVGPRSANRSQPYPGGTNPILREPNKSHLSTSTRFITIIRITRGI